MFRTTGAVLTLWFAVMMAFATGSAASAASVAGTWRLDPYVSDHPEQVARVLRVLTGESPGADLPRGRGGRGDAGHGGGGRGEPAVPGHAEPGVGISRPPEVPPTPAKEPVSDADRKLLSELTSAVRFPPATLTIAQTDTVVTMTGDAGTPLTFRTDGKAEKQPLTAGTVERTALWEGPALVVSYRVGRSGTLIYRYSLAPTTGQLVIRVSFERTPGEPGAFEVKQVYDPPTLAGRAATSP